MELSFENKGSFYEATISVSGDFNIHLERERDGAIIIKLKTSGDIFVDTAFFGEATRNFDCDFTGFVYPKLIKVISFSPVPKGYIVENA